LYHSLLVEVPVLCACSTVITFTTVPDAPTTPHSRFPAHAQYAHASQKSTHTTAKLGSAFQVCFEHFPELMPSSSGSVGSYSSGSSALFHAHSGGCAAALPFITPRNVWYSELTTSR